jgi:hypothetical protein
VRSRTRCSIASYAHLLGQVGLGSPREHDTDPQQQEKGAEPHAQRRYLDPAETLFSFDELAYDGDRCHLVVDLRGLLGDHKLVAEQDALGPIPLVLAHQLEHIRLERMQLAAAFLQSGDILTHIIHS